MGTICITRDKPKTYSYDYSFLESNRPSLDKMNGFQRKDFIKEY